MLLSLCLKAYKADKAVQAIEAIEATKIIVNVWISKARDLIVSECNLKFDNMTLRQVWPWDLTVSILMLKGKMCSLISP